MLHMVKISALEVDFNGEKIIDHLSLNLRAGEMLAIIGPNGAGKSTLLKTILGLIHPQSGSVSIDSDHRRTVVGYVPQSRTIDEETPISAKDFVALGQTAHIFPWTSSKERKVLNEMMTFTDTLRFAKKPIGKLSGGERQRTFLAQALVRHPDLLLLDESTANLDPGAQKRMMALVQKTVREWSVTVIFICHDLELVKKYADHVLLMSRNTYKMGGKETIMADRVSLKRAYETVPSRAPDTFSCTSSVHHPQIPSL